MINRFRIFELASFCLALSIGLYNPGSLKAVDVTLADNLSVSQLTSTGGNQFNRLAQGFTTTSTDFNISSVSVVIYKFGAGDGGSYEISIWDSNGSGGLPGTQVGSALFTGNVASLGTTPTQVDVNGLSKTLLPSTSYYLVVSPTSLTGIPPILFSSQTNTTTGTIGFPSNYSFWNGTNWTGPSTTTFNLIRVKASVVPEPSTYALGAIATGAFAFIARRRKTGKMKANMA
jgi:hypothetical protein